MHTIIRPRTIKLLSRLIRPLTDEGLISISEEKEIISNLRHLSNKGELIPEIMPRLIDQREAAQVLGIGHSNFKKLEAAHEFSFKRKRVGSAIRYLNLDVIKYVLSCE